MGRRKRSEVAADLAKARERFAAWRRKKRPGGRIPRPLWKLAAGLARKHGVHRTASVLRLDYYALKKQVEADGEKRAANLFEQLAVSGRPVGAGGEEIGPATFVEVPSTPWSGECVIELEDGAGASMRVSLKGHAVPDLAALAGTFWKG